MKIQQLVILFSILMTFNSYCQEDNRLQKVDSLMEIRQPNAAQAELWSVIEKAKIEKDHLTLIKSYPYFQGMVYQLEKEERAALYFEILESTEHLPAPSNSIAKLQMVQQLAFNNHQWMSYGYLKIYDSLNLSEDTVRHHFVLENIQELESELGDLNKYDFKPFQEVLLKENDSLFILNSIADYVGYQLINLYESSIIQNGGTLKKASSDKNEWYAKSTDFIELDFSKNDLTGRILNLFQTIEKNNSNNPDYLSTAVHQRLHYLKKTFNNEEAVNRAWKEQFEYFKSTSARSKFLFEIARNEYKKGKGYHFEFQPEVEGFIKEAHDDLTAELKQFPKNDFKNEIKSLISIIENKEIRISSPNVYGPNKKIPFFLEHRNYSNQVIRIYKLEDFNPLINSNLRSYALENKLKLVRTLKLDLKNKNLFQERSTELLLDEISTPGQYFILATDGEKSLSELAADTKNWNAEKIFHTQLTISEMSVKSTSSNNEYTVLVVDEKTGEPIENAEVTLYYSDYRRNRDYIELKSGKTDENGLFIHSTGDNNRISYTVEYKNSMLFGDDYVRYSNEEREISRVELYTDRSIYRPGQTVYFKGIVYKGKDNEFEVVANQKIEIVLKDASYQEVARSKFTSNEFGSIDGSFQLPKSSSLGNFSLTGVGKAEFNHSYLRFSVEEYKRPTFEVKLNQPKEEAKLNDTVSITGNAKAYAGYGISDAQLTYTIYRKWNRYWRFYNAPSSGDLLKEDTVKTDQKGEFTIGFFAEVDPNAVENAYYTYEVRVKVTDISGETHEETLSVNLSKVGLSIQVNAPSKFFTHDSEFAVIDVVSLSGEKQKGYSGKVEVYKEVYDSEFLNRIWRNAEDSRIDQEEFSVLFPNMQWNSSVGHSQKDELIKTIDFKSGDSLEINDWINNEQGNYVLKFHALTKEGDTIKAEHNLEVIDVKSKEIPNQFALWSFTSAEEVKVGNDVDFQVGSSFEDAKALVSFYRKDELVSREWVDLKNRFSKCYTVQEEDRGVLTYDVVLFHNGVFYKETQTIQVPFSNKELKIKTSTFRDLLEPGQKEQWSFTIQDENQEFVKAELAATLYDASLDQFRGHSWSLFPYYGRGHYVSWSYDWDRQILNNGSYGLDWRLRSLLNQDNLRYRYVQTSSSYGIVNYPEMELSEVQMMRGDGGEPKRNANSVASTMSGSGQAYGADSISSGEVYYPSKKVEAPQKQVAPRSNFNETAFFYPTIYSNDSNKYVLNFTLPESLTKWKLLMLGHNQEMQVGTFQKEIIAQKELMVTANAPRFVRQGDAIDFAAKVVNLTKEEQTVEVMLMLENPINQERLNLIGRQPMSKMVTIAAGASEEVVWNMNIGNQEVIQYTITASNESFSDGEKNIIPVLSNRVLITETDHVLLRKPGKTTHDFDAFKNQNSSTLDNKSYTIEYTDNLAWSAVMALPNLSKQNDQSVTSLVNSYYANAIAADIVSSNPQIQTIFNQWKSKTPDALLSELEKNEELKTILLKETPWVMDAKNETEQRRRIAQLFELNQLVDNQQNILNEIKKNQNTDGGFGWFGGGKSNAYITQNVLTRFGHLDRLGIEISNSSQLIEKAESFLANYHVKRYKEDIKDMKNYTLSSMDVYWLYSRTFFNNSKSKDIGEVTSYFKDKLKKDWTRFGPLEQAMIGIYFKSEDLNKEAQLVYSSLKDRAKKNTNLGMYWVENSGYYWYQNNIASQAMIISFFKSMDAPKAMMDDMRLWLILNKEGNAWETGVSTADAVYAILSTGRDYLSPSKQPVIKVGNQKLVYTPTTQKDEVEVECTPGLGQVKNKWTGGEISANQGTVEIERFSESPGVLNMYWQYTDELSKIKSSQNKSMEIQKTYRRIVAGAKEEKGIIDSTFTVGDKIEIELIVTVDRDLEFVHIKDLRPAGFEPTMSTSGYNYDEGLYYYQSPKDVSMEYFVDNMPKGTYKFTYTVYATHSGNFNSGVAEIQCHYAPKFSGNSGTVEVRIGR
ncbi:alpha-2-macroglobulin family protein [Brumimicrobium mesophilum]|uniref:alpha-2-macroglobulin family protein n=1 Tax=Brumimicrobium mesophilum TaxID=392717 RepID=UPI000D1439F5|nr:MG2 domain-containing protein [Brumimicrobium mesophilum]